MQLLKVAALHLDEEEVNKFGEWAFGHDFWILEEGKEFARAWNKIHGKVYKIEMKNSIIDDFRKMTDLYKTKHGISDTL